MFNGRALIGAAICLALTSIVSVSEARAGHNVAERVAGPEPVGWTVGVDGGDAGAPTGFARGGAGRGGSTRGSTGRRPGGDRPNGRRGGSGADASGSGSGSGSAASRAARDAERKRLLLARKVERSAAEADRVLTVLARHGAARALRAYRGYAARAQRLGGDTLVKRRETKAAILRAADEELERAERALAEAAAPPAQVVVDLAALARALRDADTDLHERATTLHARALDRRRQK